MTNIEQVESLRSELYKVKGELSSLKAFNEHLQRILSVPYPEEFEEVKAKLSEAEKEINEQARLNGMGGEREAALLGKLADAEKVMEKMGEALNKTRRFSWGKLADGLTEVLALYDKWKEDK